MTTQPSLFDQPRPTLNFDAPRARSTDPASSKQAGAELEASGVLSRQRAEVLAALKRFNGSTSYELAVRSGLDRYECGRRLPELASLNLVVRGPVRRCAYGRAACEWNVK